MKLSIIIPYYNADKYISGMLDSLLKQDLSADEYEIIVVDDGSKDEPKILKEYVSKNDNIRYIRQDNSGPGGARNTGIKVAQGEYIFFCDSDDYVAENVLGGLYTIAHSRNADMLFHKIRRISVDEVVISPRMNFGDVSEYPTGKDFFALPFKDIITTGVWQFIISRDFIERSHLSFPTDRIMNEDSSFWIDAILVAGPVASVDVEAYYYVHNPQSLIHLSGRVQQTERWADNMLVFIKKLTDILNNDSCREKMPQGCIDNIKWVRNQKAFIMLKGACKYLPPALFNRYMKSLKELDSYPSSFEPDRMNKTLFLFSPFTRLINLYYGYRKKMKCCKHN